MGDVIYLANYKGRRSMTDEDGDVDYQRPEVLTTDDQVLRWAVFEHMATPEIHGDILVENMEKVFSWIKFGVIANDKGKKPKQVIKPPAKPND